MQKHFVFNSFIVVDNKPWVSGQKENEGINYVQYKEPLTWN